MNPDRSSPQTFSSRGSLSVVFAAAAFCVAWFIGPAQAQLFADDEARRAIIDIRTKITQIEARQGQIETRQAEIAGLNARVEGLSRAQLDNITNAESLRKDIAQLRGALEQLTQQIKVSEEQQRKLTQPLEAQLLALTARVAALEPQAVVIDDQNVMVPAAEKSAFEAAQSLLASRAIEAGAAAFTDFTSRFPASALAPWALSLQGSAYYALKNYPSAIAALSRLSKDYPTHGRTADGLLTLAASQAESGQTTAARATLASVGKRFPGTAAAKTATQRLKALPTAKAK
ncbi:MAG: tol-pal system protein YbgF [Pseudomonadota bacterium]|jgi:tol-pal system protein YbgF